MSADKAKAFFQELGQFTESGMTIEWPLFQETMGVKAEYTRAEILTYIGY